MRGGGAGPERRPGLGVRDGEPGRRCGGAGAGAATAAKRRRRVRSAGRGGGCLGDDRHRHETEDQGRRGEPPPGGGTAGRVVCSSVWSLRLRSWADGEAPAAARTVSRGTTPDGGSTHRPGTQRHEEPERLYVAHRLPRQDDSALGEGERAGSKREALRPERDPVDCGSQRSRSTSSVADAWSAPRGGRRAAAARGSSGRRRPTA